MNSNYDAECPPLPKIEIISESSSYYSGPLNIDLPCKERIVISTGASPKKTCGRAAFLMTEQRGRERTKVPSREQSTQINADKGWGDVATQTGRDFGTNPENPHSFTRRGRSAKPAMLRNPITGSGLCGDGYGIMEPRKPKCFQGDDARKQEPWIRCRDRSAKSATRRNPITGFGLCGDGLGGFKPKKQRPCRDGNPVTGEGYKPTSSDLARDIINKSRIPPGGFSTGLW